VPTSADLRGGSDDGPGAAGAACPQLPRERLERGAGAPGGRPGRAGPAARALRRPPRPRAGGGGARPLRRPPLPPPRGPPRALGRGRPRWLIIYILIEHQSEPDPFMAFRVLEYVVQIYKRQLTQWQALHGSLDGFQFQPVLPVVLYTGTRTWGRLVNLSELL